MPCHMSSFAGRDAFADSEVCLLEYGTVFHLLRVVKPNFTPLVCIQNAQNETGNSKMPPKRRNTFDPPIRTPPPPAHAAGVGV